MIDITVDLETCSLAPTAAVMSIAAVAWKRHGVDTPFFEEGNGILKVPEFSAHVDLRSMFLNGFSFDQDTADWWARQSDEAKRALLGNDSDDCPCQPIDVVVKDLMDWMLDTKEKLGEDDIALWAQGTDFDVAILRYICGKMGIKFVVKHTNFRDHRTFYLECARLISDFRKEEFSVEDAYNRTTDYTKVAGEGAAHDPVFDCKRSIYSTWQMMRIMRQVFNNEQFAP